MIKKLLIAFFIFVGVYGNAKVNVVVSIAPQQTFVEKIGGDKVNVTTMVKPGNDPHTYEPKPSQMKALSEAQIYFPIKIEFEDAWLDRFSQQNKDMRFVEMTKGIEFINMQAHSHSHGEHHHHHAEHTDNGGLPYEWAGVFELKKGEYRWSFSKVDGKYADPAMKFLMLKALKDSNDLAEEYEDVAKQIFKANKTSNAKEGDFISDNKNLYLLNFSKDKKESIFKISIKEDGKYLFFTEHLPFEFEDKEHFFKDMAGDDVEPIQNDESDPHTWTSPANVKIMAKNIYNTLVEIDSKNSSIYKKNYENFLKEIEATDIKIKKILSSIPKESKFMVFHPSWGYFAKDYNLVQLPIEIEGKDPKPKMLQKLIDKAREEGVKAVFTQKEFSDKSAKAIASELKIKVLKETPLAKDWSENLINMAKAIANNN